MNLLKNYYLPPNEILFLATISIVLVDDPSLKEEL